MNRRSKRAAIATAALVAVTAAGSAAWAGSGNPKGPATSSDRTALAAAAAAPPVYQPAGSESRYVPVAPCAVVNSETAGGRLNTAVKTYVVTGSTGFAAQGGKATGCGVPAGATAAQLSFVVKAPTGRGTLAAGFGGKTPSNVVVAYQAGESYSVASNTVQLSAGSPGSIAVKASGGAPNLIVKVTGYYVKPIAGFIDPNGVPYAGSSRIIDGTHVGTGQYKVRFDRDIRYCSATVTPYVSPYYASASTWFDSNNPDTMFVWLWKSDGTPVDQYFYVSVSC
ncbi:MAG TPA: hypothetical protein VF426_06975 [Marmoricola sp.]